MHQFSEWLSGTPLSNQIRSLEWIIPAVQVVHILSIGIVISSALLVDLRVLGVLRDDAPIAGYVRRYLPWLGVALLALLASGATLIIGEPNRTLGNSVFWTKMVLVGLGTVLTAVFALPVLGNAGYWDSGGRRLLARMLSTLSLLIWVAAVVCGRWIAYVI